MLTLNNFGRPINREKHIMIQPLGNLFIVAAPSGAGKSSLINALIKQRQSKSTDQPDPVQLSVSHTTREPRPGETHGEHYFFTSHDEFERMISQKSFYEYAEVFGNYYGTSKAAIADKLHLGIDVFLDIDWQGARQIKRQTPDVISIFIMPPSKEELLLRLRGRGQDSPEVINKRMAQAVSEMSHYNEFDYIILNDDFDEALEQLGSIVDASKLNLYNQAMRHEALLASLLMP